MPQYLLNCVIKKQGLRPAVISWQQALFRTLFSNSRLLVRHEWRHSDKHDMGRLSSIGPYVNSESIIPHIDLKPALEPPESGCRYIFSRRLNLKPLSSCKFWISGHRPIAINIEHSDRRRRYSARRVSPEWCVINTYIILKDVSVRTCVWVCHLHDCIHLAADWHEVQNECLDNEKYNNVHLFSENLCRINWQVICMKYLILYINEIFD